MALSMEQVVKLAQGAGFTPAQSVIMGAIAKAESGLEPGVRGDLGIQTEKWGPSIGLWQIRSLKPAYLAAEPHRDASRLADPTFNAQAARKVYQAQGYSAWSVYSSGAWKRYSGEAELAAKGVTRGPLGIVNPIDAVGAGAQQAAGGVVDGLDAVGAFFGQLGQRGTWVRVLQVVGGAGLVIAGLAWLGKDIAGPVASVAADVIPQAKALKAAGAVTKAATVAKAAT